MTGTPKIGQFQPIIEQDSVSFPARIRILHDTLATSFSIFPLVLSCERSYSKDWHLISAISWKRMWGKDFDDVSRAKLIGITLVVESITSFDRNLSSKSFSARFFVKAVKVHWTCQLPTLIFHRLAWFTTLRKPCWDQCWDHNTRLLTFGDTILLYTAHRK